MQLRAEGIQAELERGDDPEVPAGTADAPEEVRLLGLAGPHEPAVGGHELDGAQVVDREPEAPLEPSDAAAERQPRDARVTDDADRADEPVRLRRDVELTEQRAAVHPRGARRRIHRHAVHRRQVHDETAVAARVPGRAVAAGADGQLEVLLAREPDRRRDVRSRPGPDDDRRPALVDRVPQPARIVVGRVPRRDDLAGERVPKAPRLVACQTGGRLHHGGPSPYAPPPIPVVPSDMTAEIMPNTLLSGSSR